MSIQSCRNCGAEVVKGMTRCAKCGVPLTRSSPVALILVFILLLGAAITVHDLNNPGDSWALHYIMKPTPAAPPASEPAAIPITAPTPAPGPSAVSAPASEPAFGRTPEGTPAPEPPREATNMPPKTTTPGGAPATIQPPAIQPAPKPPPTVVFKPPKTGSAITLKLANGTAMAGTIKTLTDQSVELEKDTVTLTLSRTQLAPESRIRLFAADYTEYMARKEAARTAAEPPAPTPPKPSAKDPEVKTITAKELHDKNARPSRVQPSEEKPAKVEEAPRDPTQRDAGDIFFDAFKKKKPPPKE